MHSQRYVSPRQLDTAPRPHQQSLICTYSLCVGRDRALPQCRRCRPRHVQLTCSDVAPFGMQCFSSVISIEIRARQSGHVVQMSAEAFERENDDAIGLLESKARQLREVTGLLSALR
jgi:hypothetical protein